MIYIPNKLKVGYQNRSGTYTGRLAYVIYYDQKGKLRKEPSWNSWRSEDIEPDEFDNTPTEGFVLNKKVGGYARHWDARQTYVRVYDPRGFEFEITVPNLLFILENTNSIKGKGLEGEFVYGWDGTDLVLIPVDSPDYIKHLETSTKLNEDKYFLDPKELKVGYKYRVKSSHAAEQMIYMGKFHEHDRFGIKKSGKRYFMFEKWGDEWYLKTFTSMKDRIYECLSEAPEKNYPELLEKMENDAAFSPIDDSKNVYEPITLKEFISAFSIEHGYSRDTVFGVQGKKFKIYVDSIYPYDRQFISIYDIEAYRRRPYWGCRNPEGHCYLYAKSWEEAFEYVKPQKVKQHLANGKLYKEGIFFE